MEFDKVIKRICGDYEFTYGIIFGNEKIVFIKAGAGGDYRGYRDKYLKMAIRAHKRMGATVICASNPINSVSTDRRAILKCVEMLGLSSFELYLVGVSDGAYLNLLLASKMPEVKRMLLINSSYIDAHGFVEKLKSFSNIEKIFVYGTEDKHFDTLMPEIEKARADSLEILTVEGADHQFVGMLDAFISLIDLI